MGSAGSSRLSCLASSVSSGISFVLSVRLSLFVASHSSGSFGGEGVSSLSFSMLSFRDLRSRASLKTGKGVHGSRVIWCFLCTGNFSRLVLNEGSTSALDYYRRARCAYIMRSFVLLNTQAKVKCDVTRYGKSDV